jgi:hypothetical protein
MPHRLSLVGAFEHMPRMLGDQSRSPNKKEKKRLGAPARKLALACGLRSRKGQFAFYATR